MTVAPSVRASAVLLDTCALIWIGNRDSFKPTAWDDVRHAGLAGGIFVSPVSAWEIGLLSASRANSGFTPNAKAWFARMMMAPGIKPAAFTPDIAIDSTMLPGDFHRDPADRLIVATARSLNVPVVTRDRKILDYAAAGHVRAIAC